MAPVQLSEETLFMQTIKDQNPTYLQLTASVLCAVVDHHLVNFSKLPKIVWFPQNFCICKPEGHHSMRNLSKVSNMMVYNDKFTLAKGRQQRQDFSGLLEHLPNVSYSQRFSASLPAGNNVKNVRFSKKFNRTWSFCLFSALMRAISSVVSGLKSAGFSL